MAHKKIVDITQRIAFGDICADYGICEGFQTVRSFNQNPGVCDVLFSVDTEFNIATKQHAEIGISCLSDFFRPYFTHYPDLIAGVVWRDAVIAGDDNDLIEFTLHDAVLRFLRQVIDFHLCCGWPAAIISLYIKSNFKIAQADPGLIFGDKLQLKMAHPVL
ncbi:hypothetical protein F7Q90_07155 [Pantoea stewartii subsp. stewartii]|nr:hypothetical protein F7Q90_07155 [Pantoea stewartii subsp. stewartii]